ncbi:hypothetical protein TNCV_3876661 [Trichonephila clavipes]|uniref:Uncharacterized protein n=1 Tax=Trichonephila clavipes TaxID=2585209 RepID=A0A8X6T5C2_TRICX|nr:hypothetical protein TNCV_3876661 [Trichonephila clavipes]
MRTVRRIILEIVDVWKFQKPSKSSNALKVCMVCNIPNFRAIVTPEHIKQFHEMQPYGDIGIENWSILAISRNRWGLDYEL